MCVGKGCSNDAVATGVVIVHPTWLICGLRVQLPSPCKTVNGLFRLPLRPFQPIAPIR